MICTAMLRTSTFVLSFLSVISWYCFNKWLIQVLWNVVQGPWSSFYRHRILFTVLVGGSVDKLKEQSVQLSWFRRVRLWLKDRPGQKIYLSAVVTAAEAVCRLQRYQLLPYGWNKMANQGCTQMQLQQHTITTTGLAIATIIGPSLSWSFLLRTSS